MPTPLPDQAVFLLTSLEDQAARFAPLAAAYRQTWRLSVALADVEGALVAGALPCTAHCAARPDCAATRRRACAEAVRWGEPSILLCPAHHVLWAVPVMENARVLGGLVSVNVDSAGDDAAAPLPARDIRRAVADLLAAAARANLTNLALLELRRRAAERESQRAEAIHELKGQSYGTIRDVYLVEEPALIAAIKGGDKAAAREILNRILVGIYFLGRDRPLLLKSFLLELIVMMSRSAVEAGGDPTELLGTNYSAFSELARIAGEEELCTWLVAMLERVMDAIRANERYPVSVLLGRAIAYMQEHLHEDISRDDAAAVACLSPSHFSRVIKGHFGQSFTELLNKMRVEKARELLIRTEKSLIQICLECGFSEQSYFTKVFQRYIGRPPGEFRRLHRAVR
ncbi:MAG TPA: helix-turn-helix domain-containing protein [Armatimonadota bacterium]|nr:helix-turn-helix domain-containing protein [Armatimonadota bacterium]HOS42883.1 helix-turn-helix domain-containing protein [Armatimonadota bacterium]